ncbi:MAG: tripartite tricarboxylate transporter substrate-binding protein [Pseudolabrys sp.]
MTEAGFPDFEAGELHGVLAPAKTPKPIIDRLHKEIIAIIKMPDVDQKFEGQGAQMVGSTPAEFKEFIKVQAVKWGKVAKDAGLKPV